MRSVKTTILLIFALLLVAWMIQAQEKTEREVNIHDNVKLIEMAIPADLPNELKAQYTNFVPMLEEALKLNTAAQSTEAALTVRVVAGLKEIGSAKTKRAIATVTAFRRNSNREYTGTMILYSYISAGPVSKDEVAQFLKQQILAPAGFGANP